MKAQVSVEYIIIISVALTVLIFISLYSTKYIQGYREDSAVSTAGNTVRKIGENADWVFSQGPPAKVTVEIYIPEGVEEITLENRTILFRMKNRDVYYRTIPLLNGSLPSKSGHYMVSLVAYNTYVDVNVV